LSNSKNIAENGRGRGQIFFALAGNGVLEWVMRIFLRFLPAALGAVVLLALRPWPVCADSDPTHIQVNSERPQPWPGGVIPYDISKLTPAQQSMALRGMQRWMETGASIKFIPRTTEV
jgi:hypothetical protein